MGHAAMSSLRGHAGSMGSMAVSSFFLIKRKRKIKAKTIGLPHGLPKRLTFRSGSDFSEVKRKRPSVKVKRLVRPLGDRFPAFWPWPAHPSRSVFGVPMCAQQLKKCEASTEKNPVSSRVFLKKVADY